MATQAEVNKLKQENLALRDEVTTILEQMGKVRKFNEELHEENNVLTNTVGALGALKDEVDAKLDKTKLLLDMCRGREKQVNRDIGNIHMIYGDLFEDMMNRQVGMAAAGWDKYYERKQKARKADDNDT